MKDGIKFGISVILCFAIIAADIILLLNTDMPMWAFWAILIVSLIVVFIPVLSFHPVAATVHNGALNVKAPFVDISIPLSSVANVELRTDFKIGFRLWGYGGIRRCSGDFSNKEFGTYTLAADTSIHAYVVIRHSRGVLVFNNVDEETTRAIYDVLIGHGISSTVTPVNPDKTSKSNRRRMWVIAGIVITSIVIVVITVVLLMFSVGYVNASMDEDSVTVDAFMAHEDIPYDEIAWIELVDGMDYGIRVGGYAGSNFLSGNFRNDDLGRYTLAVYKSTDLCIVVHKTSASAVVFNLADNDSTRAFYEALSEAVSKWDKTSASACYATGPQAC